jgi:hypothetical protein
MQQSVGHLLNLEQGISFFISVLTSPKILGLLVVSALVVEGVCVDELMADML